MERRSQKTLRSPTLSERIAFAAELRRQIEFQQKLKQCLDLALVDGVVALLTIQLREVERGQSEPTEPILSSRTEPILKLDRKSEADLINLLMAVVTVDGLTKNVELRRVREYFQEQLGYTGVSLQRVDGLLHDAQEADLEPDVVAFARPFIARPLAERILIYSACTDIAFADDEVVEEEQEFLATLAQLFQIDAQQLARMHESHGQVSIERQQAMELKVRGQFPLDSPVRFEAPTPKETPSAAYEEKKDTSLPDSAPASEPNPALTVLSAQTQLPIAAGPSADTVSPSEGAWFCKHCGAQSSKPGARYCNSCGQPMSGATAPSAQPEVASGALLRTAELMAIHLGKKNGHVSVSDPDWKKLLKRCPDLPLSLVTTFLTNSPLFRTLADGKFELARPLNEAEIAEARLFSYVACSARPVSARLMARTSKNDPERALQIVLKFAQDCAAITRYGYGCGTWIGLSAWGKAGHEDTILQNLSDIRKQLEQHGAGDLTPVERAILFDVAQATKDRVLLAFLS